ncbi:unnamed protein product [Bursaphelenchus xylophilus]|uniref:(pine wood nematode) hypothetical protein n=1 Tax=Bursaphelenchus xylophilus TaxID=6326 RepID=A0A7I8WVR4_BURXY|nr:unnamed protein product [Bursaphelenchus xylophilus]CAG9117754.1 unnamed protein product [Bursaphelenchus xylophilus]
MTANSHTFLMADHGIQLFDDETMFTDKFEAFNPLLVYIPPDELRRNPTAKTQLEDNTKQIVTHYDTYTTFIDILKHGTMMTEDYNFTAEIPTALRKFDGSSLLRPLKQPRSCKDLSIDFEGCMYKYLQPVRGRNVEKLGWRLAEASVEKMNLVKNQTWAKSYCVDLIVWKEFIPYVEEYRPQFYQDPIYQVTFKTYPGGGLYMPFLQVDVTDNINFYRKFRLGVSKPNNNSPIYMADQEKCFPSTNSMSV